MEILRRVLDLLRPHWNTLALLLTWAGILAVYLRRRAQWRRKHFLAQVNFSLNYVQGGALVMRTLLEKPAGEVWLNEYGVRTVLAAAQRTTAGQPFVLLADPRDMDFANRAVLNRLSERFAPAYLAAALGLPVRSETFRFAITCERYGEIRTLKLRVLVIAERTLTDLFGPADGAAQVEAPGVVLQARLTTLRGLHGLYLRDKGAERPLLGQVELGVPAEGPGAPRPSQPA